MIVRMNLNELKPISQKEIDMLKEAEKMPQVFDEDCPELTEEQLEQVRQMAKERREERRKEQVKQTVTIRLSPQAYHVAKSLGKGYTSVLSRILESSLLDTEQLKRYL